MKSKQIPILILMLVLLVPLTIGVGQAQEPQPPPNGAFSNAVSEPSFSMEAEAAKVLTAYAFSGGPDYDSGWVSLAQDESKTLTHNLGGNTDNYIVNLTFKTSETAGINQLYYGGVDFGAKPPYGMNEDDRVGAYWRDLTNASISVYRRAEDI